MQHGESWLYLDREIEHYWDYFSDAQAAVTNTELLFVAASRPHMDFFMSKATRIVRPSQAGELHAELLRVDPTRTVVLTDIGRDIALPPELSRARLIPIDGRALSLNLEPAWRRLRQQLNGMLFDTILVHAGPIRVVLIPRLAQVYGARALDAAIFSRGPVSNAPGRLDRIRHRIQRVFKF